MIIIPASFEILDHLEQQSMAARIELCGRICYKSEEKISESSAIPFIKGIIKHGHNSVTEMAALTLRITVDSDSLINQFLNINPKYLQIDRLAKKTILVSGTVRAFREIYMAHDKVKFVKAISGFLAARYPLFFFDLLPKRGWVVQSGLFIEKLKLAHVDTLSVDLLAKHRYLAVKLITNRAVTHEIVRHRPCSFLQESQRYCRYDRDKFGNEVTFIKPLFFKSDSKEYQLWEKSMGEAEKTYLMLLKTSSPQAARTVLPNSCKTEIIIFANLLEWLHIFKLRTTPAAEPSMREVMVPLSSRFKIKFPAVFTGLHGT